MKSTNKYEKFFWICNRLFLACFVIASYSLTPFILHICRSNEWFAPEAVWEQREITLLLITILAHLIVCASHLIHQAKQSEKPFLQHFDLSKIERLILPSAAVNFLITSIVISL